MGIIGRNSPCPCGSGKRYKRCCLGENSPAQVSGAHQFISSALALTVARKYVRAGKLREAQDLYRGILSAQPDDPEALDGLGTLACRLGRPNEGLPLLTKAVELAPTNPHYRANLGYAFMALGDSGEAESLLRAALAIDSLLPEANSNLGTILFNRGDKNEALMLFRRAVQKAPRSADAHNNLGLALWHTGSEKEALACYRRAIALDAGHVLAHVNLGNALRQKGDIPEAIRCFRAAIAIAPDHAFAHFNLGKTLSDFGLIEEAAAAYRRAIELAPATADFHNSLGLALWELGRRTEALESYRSAILLRPSLDKAYFNLHTVHLSLGSPNESIRCLEKLVELSPENAEGQFFLGMLLDYYGETARAAGLLERAAGGPPWVRASLDSYQYIKSIGSGRPAMIGTPIDAFELAIRRARDEGLVLEFGVRFGTSIRQIAPLVETELHGFDSFQGLPEAWHTEPKGSYTTLGRRPDVPANVRLHSGWFQETIPSFIRSHPGPVRFMHVDCDLYSSTRTVLELFAERIGPGSVLVFDEYFGHEHWRDDEFRALQEVAATMAWKYEYLAFSLCTRQAVVRIVSVGD